MIFKLTLFKFRSTLLGQVAAQLGLPTPLIRPAALTCLPPAGLRRSRHACAAWARLSPSPARQRRLVAALPSVFRPVPVVFRLLSC